MLALDFSLLQAITAGCYKKKKSQYIHIWSDQVLQVVYSCRKKGI